MSDTPTNAMHPFHIMAKPVCGTCNLDCQYCYYTMKPRELYPEETRFMMSDEVLEAFTKQFLAAQPFRAEVGWQGGEPLLAGKDFYRKALAFQKQYAHPGQTVTNAMQTNGTLIDDEWAELFAANGFLVGLSLDGPPEWHDTYRRDHAGNPTYHKAWAGLERLREHNVEFNVLVTLNAANAHHAGDIYRYFTNRGIQYVQFIPILERDEQGNPTEFSCTGEQFGRFMLDLFEIWKARDIGRVSERLIDSVLHSLIFGKAATCCYAERCANAHVLEYNGDLYACDHFVYPEWRIGNIMDRPLSELVGDPKLEEFAKLKTELPSACAACEYVELCRGGCPKHHMPLYGDADRVNHFCEGLKLFFREALPELRQLAEQFKAAEAARRNPAAQQQAAAMGAAPPPAGAAPGPAGAAPAGSPAQPQPGQRGPATASPPRKKPGRNAPCPCGSGRKYKACCGRK